MGCVTSFLILAHVLSPLSVKLCAKEIETFMELEELATKIRSIIEFETTRLEERIKTLYTVQSLFFVAVSVIWKDSAQLVVSVSLAGFASLLVLSTMVTQAQGRVINAEKELRRIINCNDNLELVYKGGLQHDFNFLKLPPNFWIAITTGFIWSSIIIEKSLL